MGMFANNDRKKSAFEEFLDNYPIPAISHDPTVIPAPGGAVALTEPDFWQSLAAHMPESLLAGGGLDLPAFASATAQVGNVSPENAPAAFDHAIDPYEPFIASLDNSVHKPAGNDPYGSANPYDGAMDNQPGAEGSAIRLAGLSAPLIKALAKANPQIVTNTQAILRQLSGGKLSDKDMSRLTDHVMNNVSLPQARTVGSVKPSVPLVLNQKSAKIIEELIDSFPNDELGKTIRSEYRSNLKNGRIRIGK